MKYALVLMVVVFGFYVLTHPTPRRRALNTAPTWSYTTAQFRHAPPHTIREWLHNVQVDWRTR